MVTVQQQLYLGFSIHSTVHPYHDAHSGTNSPNMSVEPALNNPPFTNSSCRKLAAGFAVYCAYTHLIPQNCPTLKLLAPSLYDFDGSGSVINRDFESYTNSVLQFAHFTLFVVPPLETDSIVPKKERFSVPQFGHGPFRIKKSLTMALVNDCAKNNIRGKAANHVNMKPKGSGSCIVQEECEVNKKIVKSIFERRKMTSSNVVTCSKHDAGILISKV
uniref:Uncharacterized protein n=1 Tax=Arundo donax TaxID=35708 RepID=A0A0A9DQV4_ARUDO